VTQRSVTHHTMVLQRSYDAAPARVFAAWSDPELKARWFKGPEDWESSEFSMDFRVGGREVNRGGPPGGAVHTYQGVYHDIIPAQRIIYTYEMLADQTPISVSLATVEFKPEGSGTRLVLTEQGAFLDALDRPELREQGTHHLLDALETELRRQATA
jgi:uncharacterized protein YndB with AHSA1/START domain